MSRQTWLLWSLFGLGLGLGMCVADFAIHWMGWEGPTTVSMDGAVICWISLFLMMWSRAERRAN